VNLEELWLSPAFQVVTVERWELNLYILPRFWHHLLEMKEAERWLKHQHRFIVQEGALWRGTPTRELEPRASYRLGVDIGERPGGETPLGGKILPKWSQPSLGEATGDKW
jgi:hypothetical protein